MAITNALTVDVEDYFQVSAFESEVRREDWDNYPSRVVSNTERLLTLFAQHNVLGTFFILGWVADRFPGLVRNIHEAGHEIAAHGYHHQLVYELSREQFRDDLRRCRDLLSDITGEPLRAYRAPSFSITKKSLWALDILVEEGFLIDTSIFPIYHDRCGIPGAKPELHQIETSAGPIWEFPPSIARIGRMNLPVGGGGYFRLYPLIWTCRCLAQINRKENRPFVFYTHPWEIDPEQPRIRAGSRVTQFRHRVNLGKTERKIDSMLGKFRFGRLCDVLEQSVTMNGLTPKVSMNVLNGSAPKG